MLVAISGSQGSGKSSCVKSLSDMGFNVIERKTSRSILTDWNVTLHEVNNNQELTIRFQKEILDRKYQDEQIAINSPDVYFTERTYGDLFTYNLLSLGGCNKYNEFVDEYYEQCMKYQQYYDKVFYLKAGHFIPEDDGVRGINVHYSRLVDVAMLDITTQMTKPGYLNIIDTPCLKQRLAIISNQI